MTTQRQAESSRAHPVAGHFLPIMATVSLSGNTVIPQSLKNVAHVNTLVPMLITVPQ